MANTTPVDGYIKALEHFLGKPINDPEYIRLENHTIVEVDGITYQISTYGDFLQDYRQYFENESYDEIATQTPEDLWELLYSHHDELTPGLVVVELFLQWERYWRNVQKRFKSEKLLEARKAESWRELQILIEAYKLEPTKLVSFAVDLDYLVFAPCIAVMLRECYGPIEDFVETCVNLLTTHFQNYITAGDTFQELLLVDGKGETVRYFVYNPDHDFADYKNEETI